MDSNERRAVRSALDYLKPYLQVWTEDAISRSRKVARRSGNRTRDIQAMVKLVIEEWDSVFARLVRPHARTYFFELKDLRNRWAHEDEFTRDEVVRATDTVNQILKVIGAPSLRGASSATASVPKGATTPKQRDTMRAIYKRVGNNKDRLIAEYAAAERRGEVMRKSNKHGTTPEDYARALIKDAEKKGWLTE